MIDNFESSNEIKFTTLSDVPLSDLEGGLATTSQETVTISTTKDDDGKLKNTPVQDMHHLSLLVSVTRQTRLTRAMKKSIGLFMAITWILIRAF